jgi:putative nucleotidyltransferase with HDIG domain
MKHVSEAPPNGKSAGPAFDERAWLGDPAAATRRKRVASSAGAAEARARGVRPFPMAAAKVLSLTGGPDFDVAAVVAAIETDVALAARVLRLVNSSAFSLRTRCSTLRHAVVLLGSGGVREAVVAGAVLNMFPGKGNDAWTSLQRHALATATLARHLAPEWRLPSDEMFTTAFLHDIGKWILLEQEEGYDELLSQHGAAPEGTLDEERGRYGFDHAELTEHLLHAWQFPKVVSRVAGMHHDPADGYADALAPRVALLRFANLLAHAIHDGYALDPDEAARTEPMTYLAISAQWLRDRIGSLGAIARGDDGDDGDDHPIAGDRPVVNLLDQATKPIDVCGFCDQPSYGVRCTHCDALLCDGHGATKAPPLCGGCSSELDGALRTAGFGGPKIAITSLVFAMVLTATALAGGGGWLLLLVPALAGYAWFGATTLRRASMRRTFLAGGAARSRD